MQKRDELTIFMDSIPKVFDPSVAESYEQWTLLYNLYDKLMAYGRRGDLEKNAAMNVDIDDRVVSIEVNEVLRKWLKILLQ
jgi:hypothetical protein